MQNISANVKYCRKSNINIIICKIIFKSIFVDDLDLYIQMNKKLIPSFYRFS